MKQFDINLVDPNMLGIVKEYPKIFLEPSDEVLHWYESGHAPEKKEDLVNLRFGFEHKSGWKIIVRHFCKNIQRLCDDAKKKGHDIQYKSCIIKEKLGGLRFQGFLEGVDRKEYHDQYYAIVEKYEQMSYGVCEITGKVGKLRTNDTGWMRTLCEEKAEELGFTNQPLP